MINAYLTNADIYPHNITVSFLLVFNKDLFTHIFI